jgi:hypothetical protein
MLVETGWVTCPVFLNGFPKAGLHLCELMVQKMAKPHTPYGERGPWVTTLAQRNFSLEPVPNMALRHMRFGQIPMTHYVKGHNPHSDELERLQYLCGHVLIIIIRDLRDVAVSQAYHMRDPDERRFPFPGKEHWQLMTGPDVLAAVIEGQGWLPSLAERWDAFKGWLASEWVHIVRFEDMVQHPVQAAKGIYWYAVERTSQVTGQNFQMHGREAARVVRDMVEAGKMTYRSPTYRKGEVGDWRDYFEDRHKRLAVETGLADQLIELGYTDDYEWKEREEQPTRKALYRAGESVRVWRYRND